MLVNVNDVEVKKGINLEKIISKYVTRILDKTRVKLEKRYNRKNDFQFMECRPYHECAVLSRTLLDEMYMVYMDGEAGIPYYAFDDPLAVVKKIHDNIAEYDQLLSHEDIDNIIVRTMLKSSKKRFYNVLESVFDNLTNNLITETYMVSFNKLNDLFFKDGVLKFNDLTKRVYNSVFGQIDDNIDDTEIIDVLTEIVDLTADNIMDVSTVKDIIHKLINLIANRMKSDTDRIIFNISELIDDNIDVEFNLDHYNITYIIINSDDVLDWSAQAPHKLSELFNDIIKTVSDIFDRVVIDYDFGKVVDHLECVKSIYGFENTFDKVNNLDLYNKVLDEFGLSDEDDDDDVDEGVDDI